MFHIWRGAEDEGAPHYLNQMIAPKNLGIKIPCTVMLIHNLSADLVNGLQGIVQSVGQDSMCQIQHQRKACISTT